MMPHPATTHVAASTPSKRGPGRPKSTHTKPRKNLQVLHIYLPDDVFDVFCRDALARGVSVHGAAKRVLMAYARGNSACLKKSATGQSADDR